MPKFEMFADHLVGSYGPDWQLDWLPSHQLGEHGLVTKLIRARFDTGATADEFIKAAPGVGKTTLRDFVTKLQIASMS